MITIKNLTKKFGRLTVLKDLSTEIKDGQITAIIGHNGCGKTTLIKCLLGLDRSTAGSIAINGHVLNGDWAYRDQIGYMPQVTRFPDNLTAAEVFSMIRDLRGVRERREADLVTLLSLDTDLHRPLGVLSGGTRQKVSAIIALMFDASVLVLDEPTAGLDPVAAGSFKARLKAERKAGKTIIITSHILSELETLADRILYMMDGRILYNGLLTELLEHTGQTDLEQSIASLMQGSPR